MSVQLPAPFIERMRNILGDSFEKFIESYDEPRTYGLRINSMKIGNDEALLHRLHSMFNLEPVPWCETGFYYDDETKPGRHPYHAAGLYYIQEPSAMSAAQYLAPNPGEKVLDLAAAPGGKATHLADLMKGQGLLVANEIHPARAAVLSENIERMGIRHAIVTSAAPGELARRFPQFFDRIMVDAPCSGEGMFRKEPETVGEWSEEQVQVCAARQLDIMDDALRMLRPGGTIAYSTCTFSVEENEQIIEHLTNKYPELVVDKIERFWPHEHRGEGHFVAVLKYFPEVDRGLAMNKSKGKTMSKASRRSAAKDIEAAMREYRSFATQMLRPSWHLPDGDAVLFGEQLYWMPVANGELNIEMLRGIKTLRPGLHLGTIRKNRFEPSHALALCLSPDDTENTHHLEMDSKDVAAWLRGETLQSDQKGWVLVCVDGYAIGWGKASNGVLKNHYPKGLRRPY